MYDKHTGQIVGFSVGDIGENFLMEQKCTGSSVQSPISIHLLFTMVRAIFFKTEFPNGNSGKKGVSVDALFSFVWEVIHQLENISCKVICSVVTKVLSSSTVLIASQIIPLAIRAAWSV